MEDSTVPKNTSKAAGGFARANKMSSEERSAAAKRAAAARWNKEVPKATHEGLVSLGSRDVQCAVLEDGTRLLTQGGFLKALGRAEKAKGGQGSTVDNMVPFLAAKNLTPFISSELSESSKPMHFITKSGAKAFGYRTDLLPQVCEVYLKAREEGALHPSQAKTCREAEIIVRNLAKLGITALVDEATGYQYARAKDALSKILEQYITEDVRKWTSTFPELFYKEMFRLKEWSWTEKSVAGKRPGVVGKYTDDIVYDRLAPSILEELRNRNPKIANGRRKYKHFQWLTGEIGHPKLMAHLEGVTLLMRQAKTWDELKENLDKFYPIHVLTETGIETNVKRRKIGSKT